MFTVDAHLDLSMNALEWNRDLRQSLEEIRAREKGLLDKPDRGNSVVNFPSLRSGNVGLVVATQIGRYVSVSNALPGWHSPEQAWAQTQGQLAWYRAMEEAGELVQIRDLKGLDIHLENWKNASSGKAPAIGYILSLEGADSLITIEHLHRAHAAGLRALGPAHYGPGRYAFGTDSNAPMGQAGLNLLKEMEKLGIILDVTHLCEDAFWQALDHFQGPVWASHQNCRVLVDHNRQLSDLQIKELLKRNAVIGAALDAWMMVPGWIRGKSNPRSMNCSLSVIADHINHICQLAGDSLHVGIGSDLDGGFGSEQCPYDLESIADLGKVPDLLEKKGYTRIDIENIMSGNWLRFLRMAWS